MLNATIDLHLKKFSSSVAQDMKENLYVDNLISGSNSEDTIINYYKQTVQGHYGGSQIEFEIVVIQLSTAKNYYFL